MKIALAGVFHATFACAQSYRFTHLDIASGLSSNSVSCVLTDSRGFTWIGTDNGLNCYDGAGFQVNIHHRNDNTSIPHNSVLSLAEDVSENIIVATPAGIARVNPWNKKSQTIAFADAPVTRDPCTNCCTDDQKTVWCWSLTALYKLNPISGQLELILACDHKEGRPDRISGFYHDRENRYWICSYSGLCLFDPAARSTEIFRTDGDHSDLVMTMWEDSENNFWCGDWGGGISKFLPEEKKFERVRWHPDPEFAGADNISLNYVETTGQDGQKILWASTNAGLAIIDRSQKFDAGCIHFIHHEGSNAESPASDHISKLYVNAANQLWVPSVSGVSILLPEVQNFRERSANIVGVVTQIVPGANGEIFVCTWHGNGLQKIDSSGNVTRMWKRIPASSPDPDHQHISGFMRARDSSMWIASFGGLFHGDAEGNSFEEIQVMDSTHPGLPTNHVTCVAESREGTIWCGTYGRGLCLFDPLTKTFSLINKKQKGTFPLPADLIWSIQRAHDDAMWIGTNGGVAVFDPRTGQWSSFTSILADDDSIVLGICRNLYEDRRHNMWICTGDGLARKNPQNEWSYYDAETGPAGNDVEDIKEDEEGNLWVTSNGGLSLISSNGEVITNYSQGNGFPAGAPGAMCVSGNKMFVSIESRIFSFEPLHLIAKPSALTVYITSITAGGNIVNIPSNPANNDTLNLAWADGVITFDFVSPGINIPDAVQYEYRLTGAEEKWTNSGNRHFASYAGLAPGHYTFEVRASIRGGPWSNSTVYGFTVHPPFWKTWWFITGILLFIFISTVLIVRRESTRKFREKLLVLEKQQAVEMERNRISRDMHDDLGSGLTKIAIMSEVVKQKLSRGNNVQSQVDTISESARNLVDNLNEIIWALNPGNDNLENLAAYIREYANNYLEPFNIHLTCEIQEELPETELSEQVRRFLFLVVKESLHNIVKHAQAKNVSLILRVEEQQVKITLTDDGKGFELSDVRINGNGLKNMETRMRSIGGTFRVESTPGKGTHTQITYPLK